MEVSINRGPQNRPQYTRAPKKGPLILGNSHIGNPRDEPSLLLDLAALLRNGLLERSLRAPARRTRCEGG